MANHDRYRVEVHFTICDGMRDKALEELKNLLNHIQKNALDHASDLKTYVHHTAIDEHGKPIEETKETV